MSADTALPRAAGTGGSVLVDRCQVCGSAELERILFVGYLPPVNTMPPIGARPIEQPSYPAELLQCARCALVQLGTIVDPAILFPPSYPYTSGTTRILRENFAELRSEVDGILRRRPLTVVDVGSNDGTLLASFQAAGHRVLGIEPTNAAQLAIRAGIPTKQAFFAADVVSRVLSETGPVDVVTATNVFAHIEDVHEVVRQIERLLDARGIFVSESHYWLSLVEDVQYDTIYHEHLRYYSIRSLQHLLGTHDLEVFHAKRIPTHGGSIRVYAARRGAYPPGDQVTRLLGAEDEGLRPEGIARFRERVTRSKLELYRILADIAAKGEVVYGVGAPSRASTLINYVGLDDGLVQRVVEVPGSHKIGNYIPGTLIPVVPEDALFSDQPEYALLLSWHIAEELMPKLRAKGFGGGFIVPLPEPRIVTG